MSLASTPRSKGIVLAESAGLTFMQPRSSLIISASDFIKAVGLGYGATSMLSEWQNQATLELETLLSSRDYI